MHLLIPFASALSEAGRQAISALRVPQLDMLVARWRQTSRDDADETSLSPPHERCHARAIGLGGADGLFAWAALEAHAVGLPQDGRAWGALTPVHWRVGTDQVSLADPRGVPLTETESRAFFDVVRELFTSEGFEFVWRSPGCWLAAHPSFSALPTASLDRVIGRPIHRWLPGRQAARLIRRLQNEVQMLLHEHPLNEAREAAGQPPINSFWLSGCGPWQAARPAPDLQIDERLRTPALAEDWPAWSAAWAALDAGPIARLREGDHRLSLCGERSAVELAPGSGGLWQRLRAGWRAAPAAALLATL